jgi:predicted MFS family arabinose efflux permease
MFLKPNNAPRLRYQLIAATFGRMTVNTAQRMFHPFLTVFSRGLGVPLETLALMLSLRGAFGMSAPLFGPVADRFGRRNAMLIGVAIFCIGLALAGFFPSLPTVLAAILLVIVCKFIFDPALQAYLAERTPYSQRGLVIALTEFGWSGAILIGIPILGELINRWGWRSPFLPLAGVGLLAGAWIALVIPSDPPHVAQTTGNGLQRWLIVMHNPAVVGTLAINVVSSGANESLSVVYAGWLEQSFAFSVLQLGLTGTVIGISEMIAEGGVAVLSDRLGKRLTLALGLIVSALSYFLLPVASGRIEWALAGLFVVYLAFEFAIVAAIPLLSELMPDHRSTVMSTAIASHAAGRMLGSLIGVAAFRHGFVWNGVAAGLMTALGIPLILWVVRERK